MYKGCNIIQLILFLSVVVEKSILSKLGKITLGKSGLWGIKSIAVGVVSPFGNNIFRYLSESSNFRNQVDFEERRKIQSTFTIFFNMLEWLRIFIRKCKNKI